jgi:hypothetical protein
MTTEQLTPERRRALIVELNNRILDHQKEIRRCNTRLNMLRNECKHKVTNSSTTAFCDICGETFGWFCPESPDKVCHCMAECEEDQLCLNDGTCITLSESQLSVSYDDCVFCGQPDERK